MSNSLELAGDLVHLTRGSWHLFFRSETLEWVLTDKIGVEIIHMVGSHMRMEDIAEEMATRHGLCAKEIEGEIRSFVDSLRESHIVFFEGDEKRAPHNEDVCRPADLYLHLTTRCNLQCTYCYNRSWRKRRGLRDLPVGLAKKALQEAEALGIRTVLLTGGEPLLHPRALEIAGLSRQMGFRTVLLTNGVLIDEEFARKIAATCDQVTVSLDSAVPELHELHRGKSTHKRVTEAIRLLKEAGTNEVVVEGVITRQNQGEAYAEFEAFAKEIGADRVAQQIYILQGDERDAHLSPDFSYFLRKMDDAIESMVESGELRTRERVVWRDRCGAACGVIAIDADGTVYPCQGLMKKEFAAGNISTVSLAEAFEKSPVFQRVKKISVADIPRCRECAFRYLCGGGCRALAYNIGGSLTASIPDRYCTYNQLIAERKLWAAALFQHVHNR